MIYILDACALIALLKKEEGAEKIRDILKEAKAGTSAVYISIVNLIEVHYVFTKPLGKEAAAEILAKIPKLPIQIIDTITIHAFDEAVRIRSTYNQNKTPISLADVIGLGAAINLKGVFVTSDGELAEPKARENAPVFWFRPPKEKQAKKKPDVNAITAERDQAVQALAEANRRIAELETQRRSDQ
jgi:PIN domain nuclease of toxin-antitoxin system